LGAFQPAAARAGRLRQGIDNFINTVRYRNFHPCPQRSGSAELRFDL